MLIIPRHWRKKHSNWWKNPRNCHRHPLTKCSLQPLPQSFSQHSNLEPSINKPLSYHPHFKLSTPYFISRTTTLINFLMFLIPNSFWTWQPSFVWILPSSTNLCWQISTHLHKEMLNLLTKQTPLEHYSRKTHIAQKIGAKYAHSIHQKTKIEWSGTRSWREGSRWRARGKVRGEWWTWGRTLGSTWGGVEQCSQWARRQTCEKRKRAINALF